MQKPHKKLHKIYVSNLVFIRLTIVLKQVFNLLYLVEHLDLNCDLDGRQSFLTFMNAFLLLK